MNTDKSSLKPPRWGEITVGRILGPMGAELVSGSTGTSLRGLSTDSRTILPGELFWALKGDRYDGHDFISQALGRGAAAIIVGKERAAGLSRSDAAVIRVEDTLAALGDLAHWWRKAYDVRVAAITGSVGKTTTKDMVAKILSIGAPTLKNEGNRNNLFGLPLTLFQLEGRHRTAVLEMGMNRPGEIARLTDIAAPDVGLITRIGKAHLEGLVNMRGVAAAKAELIERIPGHARIILNGDDQLLMEEAARFGRELITFGLDPDNLFRAREIRRLEDRGTAFELHFRSGGTSVRLPVRLRIPGVQNVYNAMAAAAISIHMGSPLDHVAEGLGGFNPMKGRFVPIELDRGATLVDDTYNSNPTSLSAALDTVRDLSKGADLIIGLGEMMELGRESEAEHREAGRRVAELAPRLFLAMGDHAAEMISGALSLGFPPQNALEVGTHLEMAERIKENLKKGDLVLLKGSRGMRLERVIEEIMRTEKRNVVQPV